MSDGQRGAERQGDGLVAGRQGEVMVGGRRAVEGEREAGRAAFGRVDGDVRVGGTVGGRVGGLIRRDVEQGRRADVQANRAVGCGGRDCA